MKILGFKSAAAFRRWLLSNHESSEGLWLRIAKKASGETSLTYAEALDEALCFGWIDGLKRAHDDQAWLQKFTPRRPRSQWSKVNTQHAERLAKAGRMAPAGHRAVKAAKDDGRWKAAYDSPASAEVPSDFLKALRADKKAFAFFETLNRANRYAIAYRLQTAKKPETRARRMKLILAMLARGEKFH